MQENILQAYKKASDMTKQNLNIGAEIDAYKEVIKIGEKYNNPNRKYQTLMAWAYNGIENAIIKENSKQKWLKNKLEQVALLKPEEKRDALQAIADKCSETVWKILIYEKALNFVAEENISFEQKCINTINLCVLLLSLYSREEDTKNWQRINNLLQKTAILALTNLENRLDEESDSNLKMQLFEKILNLENKYLPFDINRKKCLYRRLNLFLKPHEEIEINGVTYNHETIKNFLRQNAF